jgi:hypothetical protein
MPLFNYIYQGPYLLASGLQALGINPLDSYKMIMYLGYFLGVSGVYAIFAWRNKILAVAAGLLFALSPYLFLDIFVRGALGEIVVIGFMPWVIYGINKKNSLITSMALFLVLISHNFFGLIFLLFLISWAVVYSKLTKESVKSMALGLGLAAFFLIPMVVERSYITSGATNQFSFDYQQQFLYLPQLIYSKWDYWYSGFGSADGMSFQLGFANIIIFIVSIISLTFIKVKKYLVFLIGVVSFSLFLTLNYSAFLWKWLPFLAVLQFPWRFLFIPVLVTPLIFFELIIGFPKLRMGYKYLFSFLLIILAVFNVRNYRRPREFVDLNYYEKLNTTTTTYRSEIAPKWSPKAKINGNQVIDSQTNEVIPVVLEPGSIKFNIKSNKTIDVTIYKNYFPGFKLIDLSNQNIIPIKPDSMGNVMASLKSGNYQYKYGQTKIEIVSNLISIISFCIILIMSLPKKRIFRIFFDVDQG